MKTTVAKLMLIGLLLFGVNAYAGDTAQKDQKAVKITQQAQEKQMKADTEMDVPAGADTEDIQPLKSDVDPAEKDLQPETAAKDDIAKPKAPQK